MSVTSLLFCIVPLICINLQVSNQVQIQNSWIHNTKLLCVKQNASYVANSKCNMELVSRSTELSNIDIVLQPNVVLHNLHVLVSTNHRSSSLQYRPVLVNYRANFCEAISSKKFILPINTTNNIMKGCPYRERIYIEKWKFTYEDDKVPPTIMFMDGQWRLDILLITKHMEVDHEIIMLQQFFEIRQNRV